MVAPLFRVVARGGWIDVSAQHRRGWGHESRTGLIKGIEPAKRQGKRGAASIKVAGVMQLPQERVVYFADIVHRAGHLPTI